MISIHHRLTPCLFEIHLDWALSFSRLVVSEYDKLLAPGESKFNFLKKKGFRKFIKMVLRLKPYGLAWCTHSIVWECVGLLLFVYGWFLQ